MSDNHQPCRHNCDWTDGDDDPEIHDHGCCAPIPERRDCLRPVLPVPDCDEQDPVVTFDPDAEEFFVTTVLYDENCSSILDQNSDQILTVIN